MTTARKHLEQVNRYRRFDALSEALGRSMRRYFRLPRRPVKGPPVVLHSPAMIQLFAVAAPPDDTKADRAGSPQGAE